ncbi:phosphate acetyltransferase [Rubritalea halochordaticola]|uniref:Phosphate acetyltransferase n=1 Tax=Rubritalea halochordaticola TaxID=714537 RepID=A0ABP9UYN6_9BACT
MSEEQIQFSEANALTKRVFETLKRHPKRIVFTEGEDERVIRVARRMVELQIAAPILLGDKLRIRALAAKIGVKLDFVNVMDPKQSSDLDLFCRRLEKMEKYRGREVADAREMMARPHNFAAMMIQYSQADGMVSGNKAQPVTIYRALMNFVKPMPGVPKLFSVVAMVAPHLQHFGSEDMLFLTDCGVNPKPDVNELAISAIEAGKLARHFMGRTPRVALLSHSTHGSMPTDSSKKVVAATAMARELAHRQMIELDIDGELQADVALDLKAAETKLADSRAETPADVLVFPNLDSGHIAFKLLQHVGGAQVYGHLLMGLTRPAAQVPVTVSEESLLGTAAMVGAEAIKFRQMYPDGEVE